MPLPAGKMYWNKRAGKNEAAPASRAAENKGIEKG